MLFTEKESMSELSHKGACLAFFSAYDNLDIARMIGLAMPNAEVHFLPLGEDGKGLFWSFGKTVWDSLIESFPDLSNTINSFHTEGEKVRANVTICGTQAKDFLGIKNKGLSFNSDHVFVFEFNENGNIQNMTVDWDHAGLVQQLGG